MASLTRLVGVDPANGPGPDRARAFGVSGLASTVSRALGGGGLLERRWQQLGTATLLARLAAGSRRGPIVDGVLFTLVADRSLAPSSKLAATCWMAGRVNIPGIEATSDDACSRAMDW